MKALLLCIVVCSLVGVGVQATLVILLWSLLAYALISGILLRVRAS